MNTKLLLSILTLSLFIASPLNSVYAWNVTTEKVVKHEKPGEVKVEKKKVVKHKKDVKKHDMKVKNDKKVKAKTGVERMR